MSGTAIAAIVAIVVLVGAAAFLALAETAFTHLTRTKAIALEEDGRRGAQLLSRLLEHPEQVLNPVLLLVLVCHLVAATLVGVLAQRYFGVLGIAGATVIEVVVIFVVAEAAPKTYALQHAERAGLIVAPVVGFVARLAPVRLATRALIGLANLITPGRGTPAGPFVSETELLAIADVAAEEEVIEDEERALIESIIEFGDTVVREVMVPRPDMVTIGATATIAEALELVLDRGYSRVPVYGESSDDIVGVVYAKDLMRAQREGRLSRPVSTLLRDPRFVPETKHVAELMREMQAEKYHLAIVVDEYGGTAGLVTLEDLIEELVGEIVDEYDIEEPLVEPLPTGELRVDARLPIAELEELLGSDLPEGDWDTVGGLMFSLLGHVPAEGEVADFDGHRLRAEKVHGRRIGRVRVSPLPLDKGSVPARADQPARDGWGGADGSAPVTPPPPTSRDAGDAARS